jgi:hypothetical protein
LSSKRCHRDGYCLKRRKRMNLYRLWWGRIWIQTSVRVICEFMAKSQTGWSNRQDPSHQPYTPSRLKCVDRNIWLVVEKSDRRTRIVPRKNCWLSLLHRMRKFLNKSRISSCDMAFLASERYLLPIFDMWRERAGGFPARKLIVFSLNSLRGLIRSSVQRQFRLFRPNGELSSIRPLSFKVPDAWIYLVLDFRHALQQPCCIGQLNEFLVEIF